MAPKLGFAQAWPLVLRDDGRDPLYDEVRAAVAAIRRPNEPIHPSDRSSFHGGWSLHAEAENRSRPWISTVTEGETPRNLGSESFGVITGIYVEYVPNWPYVDYDAKPGIGSYCVSPELEGLRKAAYGGRDEESLSFDEHGDYCPPKGPWHPPLADEAAREAAKDGYAKLKAKLRREEHDAGIALLTAELDRRGIACEIRGSMLAGNGERRTDAFKAKSLNRRSTAVYVPLPEPTVTHYRAANLGAIGEAVRLEYAESLGMTVDEMEADVAARLVARMPAAFDGHGVPLTRGHVNLRKRPLGGLVPDHVDDARPGWGDGSDARELPPLA